MLCSPISHMNASWLLILVIGGSPFPLFFSYSNFDLLILLFSSQLGQVTSLLTSGSRIRALRRWKPSVNNLHLRCWALLARSLMPFRYEHGLWNGLLLNIELTFPAPAKQIMWSEFELSNCVESEAFISSPWFDNKTRHWIFIRAVLCIRF
jgi:hypothetical protein